MRNSNDAEELSNVDLNQFFLNSQDAHNIVQKYSSQKTSINSKKLPAVFLKVEKHLRWTPNTVNLDIGGGKYDNASEYLFANHGIINLVYDRFNRPPKHNLAVISKLREEKADTVTISNVLNVIFEESIQISLLKMAFANLKDGGKLYVTIYSGDRTGVGRQSGKDQWQENKPLKEYKAMISSIFGNCEIKNEIAIAVK